MTLFPYKTLFRAVKRQISGSAVEIPKEKVKNTIAKHKFSFFAHGITKTNRNFSNKNKKVNAKTTINGTMKTALSEYMFFIVANVFSLQERCLG